MTAFDLLVLLAAFLAGAVASVAGFGIGSLLTPLLAVRTGMRLAVALVTVPHLIGTVVRFWQMRGHVDRRIFLSFGLMSAAGGLTGALVHVWVGSRVLTLVLGGLLVFAGGMGLLGLTGRLRFHGTGSWVAGALSGFFGGLVGNQGGIRSAALLGTDLPRDAFVATATAIGLVIDLARLPVYVAAQGGEMANAWRLLLVATAGVVVGTLVGRHSLRYVPEPIFRRVLAALLLVLGVGLLVQAIAWS